ncbi:MAG: carboxypeptidase-like regulatory domain-containing protein, partial [Bacteroidetes bacterium]|nr:carboxypeptidase-like regulatory domain-containing protein [Bacteroidota bacterium]
MKYLNKPLKKSYLLMPFLVLAFWFGSVHEAQSQNTVSKEIKNFTEFKGKILDAQTSKALVFATITIKGTNSSTVSNAHGDFVLKVPNSLLKNAVEVSFLGYEKLTKQLDVKTSNAFNLALEPAAIALNEVDLIIPKDAKTLVEETLARKGENYFNSPTLMTAFYRETIKKRRKNVSLSEAVVSIYKSPYVSNRKDDVVLYKARKSTDYTKLDTLALKLQGGPFNTLYIDVMKYPEYLFSETYMDLYEFSYGTATRVNDQLVYIVNFEPRSYDGEPLFKGQLF